MNLDRLRSSWLRFLVSLTGGPTASRVLRRTQEPVDRWVARVTDGRYTLASLATGLDIVRLETVGARSGEPRPVMVLTVPFEQGHVVVGSNYGGPKNPAWVHNLRAHPEIWASMRGYEAFVRAVELHGSERDRAWRTVAEHYPAFPGYARRAAPRVIPVFALHVV